MSELASRIEKDLIQAMKSKNAEKLAVLRLIKTAITNYKIEKHKELLKDEEVLEILNRQFKQRKESIACFETAGRADLKEKEEKELSILQSYMPAMLTADDIKQLAIEAIQSTQAKSKHEIGRVMKELMPRLKGRADGTEVNQILSSLLA